ncbi:MAG: hypothetical protein HYT87_14880 [Nitrospirae bacterium]|nr:hypothetical protein [Nitrospirota bacterium]
MVNIMHTGRRTGRIPVADLEQEAVGGILQLISHIGVKVRQDRRPRRERGGGGIGWDRVLRARHGGEEARIGIRIVRRGEPSAVLEAIGVISLIRKRPGEHATRPIIFAPSLTERAMELCDEADVGYLDRLGNVAVRFLNVVVQKEKEKSMPWPRRELRHLFAPKTSRAIRVLLTAPARAWTQKGLADEADVNIALVNRLVRRLKVEGLVALYHKRWIVTDPKTLLGRWLQAYAFGDAHLSLPCFDVQGAQGLYRGLRDLAEKRGLRWAVTLYSGANMRSPFTTAQVTHVYIGGADVHETAEALELRPVGKGANVVLIEPGDEGVFHGAREIEGVPVVSDLQLYLDLKTSGGRAAEQAEHLVEKGLVAAAKECAAPPLGIVLGGIPSDVGGEDDGAPGDRAAQAVLLVEREIEKTMTRGKSRGSRRAEWLRATLWLLRLQAAMEEDRKHFLESAERIVSTDTATDALEARGLLDGALVSYGRALRNGLKARWETDPHDRKHYRADFQRQLRLLLNVESQPTWLRPWIERLKTWSEDESRGVGEKGDGGAA